MWYSDWKKLLVPEKRKELLDHKLNWGNCTSGSEELMVNPTSDCKPTRGPEESWTIQCQPSRKAGGYAL